MIATFFSTLAGIVFAKFMYALPEKYPATYSLPQNGAGGAHSQLPSAYASRPHAGQPDMQKKKKGGIFH